MSLRVVWFKRDLRVHGPVKQSRDQDPDGSFIRRWVPKLAEVPDAWLHAPWEWPEAERLLGRGYPERIVDHQAAARAARQAMGRMRASAEARRQADAIQERHGSRKSGVRDARYKSRRARAETRRDDRQSGFDFGDRR